MWDDPGPEPPAAGEAARAPRQLAVRLVLALLLGLLLGGLLMSFGVRFVRVEGDSMAPNLEQGDVVLVLLRPVFAWRIRPGDVVLAEVRGPRGGPPQQVIKRVARLIDSGGERFFFLRGDRPAISRDSRSFGPVPRQRVLGHAWLVFPRESRWRLEPVRRQLSPVSGSSPPATGSGPEPAGR